VHARIYEFFTKFVILYKHQFGFRSHHSTSLAILEVVDFCYENVSNKNHVLGIYIDLQKAFDTVNHDILLYKLQHYGIRGHLYNWFKSYLSQRKMYTVVNGVKSNESPISVGVPQGSVLGPLLFLISMNGISKVCDTLKLFADDTNLFLADRSLQALGKDANQYLKELNRWFLVNKLSINVDKTCYTLFNFNKNKNVNINLKIDNKIINKVECCKYLGIFIDEKLNWSDHIDFVYNKLLKFASIFYKLRDILPFAVIRQLYFALVYPHINYGVEIYANCYNATLNKLNILNNKIIRTVLNKDIRTNIASLYKSMSMLPVFQLHQFNILLFVQNIQLI